MKYFVTTLTTIMAFGTLTFSIPVVAQGVCQGQIGAGYGMCISAGHLGCGTESENNTNACKKIEENFLEITGEVPPWLEPETESICGVPKPLAEGVCVYGFPEIGCFENSPCESSNDCDDIPEGGLAMCVLPGKDFPDECGLDNEENCFYINP